MKKFREILFLKSIKGVAKKTIYKKYWSILVNSKDNNDLVNKIMFKIDNDKIKEALEKSEEIYNQIIENPEINIITVFDEIYPKKLNVMGDKKPLILYIKGNIDALTKPNISVIGTRKPSSQSEEFEKNLVENILNNTDRVVVSGLALGCDKIAHQTTVEKNKPTIAVLPSGLNVIKPAKHKKLAGEIIETGGCLITEYEPDKTPYKKEYVERDAIVAAFSDATFVVECGVKSGTMHTVDFANDYSRQIFAYCPQDASDGDYTGNNFILSNKKNSIKVNDIDEFISELNNLNNKKETVQSSIADWG